MAEIFICNACRYIFEKSDNIDRCPDCGKMDIRPATNGEQEEYHKLRIEFGYTEDTD